VLNKTLPSVLTPVQDYYTIAASKVAQQRLANRLHARGFSAYGGYYSVLNKTYSQSGCQNACQVVAFGHGHLSVVLSQIR
jgi:hypothetical protein